MLSPTPCTLCPRGDRVHLFETGAHPSTVGGSMAGLEPVPLCVEGAPGSIDVGELASAGLAPHGAFCVSGMCIAGPKRSAHGMR